MGKFNIKKSSREKNEKKNKHKLKKSRGLLPDVETPNFLQKLLQSKNMFHPKSIDDKMHR